MVNKDNTFLYTIIYNTLQIKSIFKNIISLRRFVPEGAFLWSPVRLRPRGFEPQTPRDPLSVSVETPEGT